MEYQIEKNVPLPEERRQPQPGSLSAVINEMEPGDSLVVLTHSQRMYFGQRCRKLGIAYITRRELAADGKSTVFRCWHRGKMKRRRAA